MTTLLLILAVAFFLVHVLLIFTSFPKKGYNVRKYTWSHITLWLAGTLLTLFLWQSAEPVFDTPLKRSFPLFLALGLSLIAHIIVRAFILPRFSRSRSGH